MCETTNQLKFPAEIAITCHAPSTEIALRICVELQTDPASPSRLSGRAAVLPIKDGKGIVKKGLPRCAKTC